MVRRNRRHLWRQNLQLMSRTLTFLWAPWCVSKGINLQRPQAGSSEVFPAHSKSKTPLLPIRLRITQKIATVSSLLHMYNAAQCLSVTSLQMSIYVTLSHCNLGWLNMRSSVQGMIRLPRFGFWLHYWLGCKYSVGNSSNYIKGLLWETGQNVQSN